MASSIEVAEAPANITGLATESNAITQLGKDPAKWLALLNDLEKVEDGPRKLKLLGCFFSRIHRHLSLKDHCRNESYVIILGKEALFSFHISENQARLKFESASLMCQSPTIHIMYAQFELDCGDCPKAMKILCDAKIIFKNDFKIDVAIKKLNAGFTEICSPNYCHKKSALRETKLEAPAPSSQNSNCRKEQNQMDVSVNSLHNLSISTPKLNKHGTERLLRRQKDLVNIIDKCDNVNQSCTHSPVANSSTLNLDIDLQSPAAPDLSMLSREFQPSATLRQLESAKKSERKNHESPVLKPVENKRIQELSRSRTNEKTLLTSQSSNKKLTTFSQGPQRVLRNPDGDSDDESPKRPLRKPNIGEENNKASVKVFESKQTIPTTVKPTMPDIVPTSGSSIPATSASSFNKSYNSAFKQTVQKNYISDNKENKLPVCNVSAPGFVPAKKTSEPPLADFPRKRERVFDERAPLNSAVSTSEVVPRGRQHTLPTASELIQDKKVLSINGVPYIVLDVLGKGGSSKVYKVYNPKNSHIVAVKQVNLTDGDQQVLESYKNEISFLSKLQGSRYIVKLIDYELKERCLYVVMECGSSDLSVFLKNQRASHVSLEIIDIKMLWKNMLRAVQAIHKHGIIHLDLKPANFMFMDCHLKLIDFGIANSIQDDATSVIKDTQFGTLNYMAPEMINDMSGGVQCGPTYQPKFKVGPKADVWSLGCILYYIMYGHTPFQHIHHQTMKLFAITNENHKIDFPNFPVRGLVEIAQACLVRDPKKRPSVDILLEHPILS